MTITRRLTFYRRYSITIFSGNKSITTLAASAITVSIPEPEKVEVQELRHGLMQNDQDGKRPSSITVKLYADGNDTGKTATANAAGKLELFVRKSSQVRR